jgi:hypothetical protein
VVKVPGAFPPALIAREIHKAKNWKAIFLRLSKYDVPDEAWFEPGDEPQGFPESTMGSGEVKSWDGEVAIVEHDGPCILILRRTYYPGWFFELDEAPPQLVLKVNYGFQAVPLLGSGTRRIVFHYRPTGLWRAATVSLVAIVAALVVVVVAALRGVRLARDQRVMT